MMISSLTGSYDVDLEDLKLANIDQAAFELTEIRLSLPWEC